MIANQKALFLLIEETLEPHGYIKKKDTWYLHTLECICFFTLGKSPFAGRYEDLLGCFVKDINKGIGDFPVFYKKNLGYGLDSFIGKEEGRRIFDLENTSYIENQRELRIQEIMEDYAIPFLSDIGSISGIRKAIKKYQNLKYDIDVDLQEYLKIKVH